jgi:hypothetical protein
MEGVWSPLKPFQQFLWMQIMICSNGQQVEMDKHGNSNKHFVAANYE